MKPLKFNEIKLISLASSEGSLKSAAEKIGVSSANASRSLALLEDNVGLKIYDRAGRGLEPTDFGRYLSEYAKKIDFLHTEMMEFIANYKKNPSMK